MSETKEEISAQRDALLEENKRLSAQLTAAGRPAGAYQPAQTFTLTEGARQELELYGVTNIDGKMMTIDAVREKIAGTNQAGVPLADPDPATDRRDQFPDTEQARAGIRGFDYVYPSVAPGLIDPAVAGTPGINGPAADSPERVDNGDGTVSYRHPADQK